MSKYGDWETIETPLGEGGQSVVYLARTPQRMAERAQSFNVLSELSGQSLRDLATAERFAKASQNLARSDSPSELGAVKVFKIREGGAPAEERLKREITVLRESRKNLPKLLDANETERWMVTEYFPGGTLDKSPFRYQGKPILALRAFRTLVETIKAALHEDGIVHRDIKPANVFIDPNGTLIPGDFGIVFVPDQGTRVTVTHERVGPWEYMPQWADLGERHENVKPSFDVYMLAKLLWCMVAGRLRLPREYHRRADFDLEKMFPDDKYMPHINSILDKCLVENADDCLSSAKQLLQLVDATLALIEEGTPLVNGTGQLILPCRVCGKGFYQEHHAEIRLHSVSDEQNRPTSSISLGVFICNVCTHYAFFAPGSPKEAAARNWRPWASLKS
jgi:serine/threonine protein kinase